MFRSKLVVIVFSLILTVLMSPWHQELQAESRPQQQNMSVYIPLIQRPFDPADTRMGEEKTWVWPGTQASFEKDGAHAEFSHYEEGARYFLLPLSNATILPNVSAAALSRQGLQELKIEGGTLKIYSQTGAPVKSLTKSELAKFKEQLAKGGIKPQQDGEELIVAGTVLGTAALVATLGTAALVVGCVVLAVAAGLLIGYLIVQAIDATQTVDEVLPPPNTIGGSAELTQEVLAWGRHWMAEQENEHGASMWESMGPDFAQPNPGDPNDPCQYFRNLPGNRWDDSKLELRITDKTVTRAEAEIWDRAANKRIGFAEAEYYGGVGHRYVKVDAAYRGNGYANALLHIVADLLGHARGELGLIEFVVENAYHFASSDAFRCLRSRASNIRPITENTWLQDQPAFIEEAKRLGMPDYLGGGGGLARLLGMPAQFYVFKPMAV